jgi:hypothetical protein
MRRVAIIGLGILALCIVRHAELGHAVAAVPPAAWAALAGLHLLGLAGSEA